MSSTTPTITSSSNFRLIIDTALANYKEQTGIDLTRNELGDKLQHPDGVLEIFQERETQFKDYRDRNRKLIDFLKPAVQILHALSGTFGEVITLAPFPPAKAIFVGIDVLLAAASGVSSSYDALEDLFECIQNFLKRLHVYTEIPPTDAMTHILVKVMIELLSVLALATKQVKQGRFKKFAKKLLGESEVESVLQRLDRLTQEEARMTVAQTLEVVHGLMCNMRVVMDDGKASMSGIRQALVDMQETANTINKMERDQLERDVRNWLSPPDPSSNQNIAREAHQTGTATWFFEEDVFSEWKERGSLLWIHGKPGSGKSILLSAIIHDIEGLHAAGLASMAYYYFDFRDAEKQHRHGLLASLLIQLSSQSNLCHDILSRLYATHKRGTQKPADATLTEVLKEMLELSGQGPIYIIIDALDECPDNSGLPSAREKVLDLIEELVELQLPNVRVCITSRPEIDIRNVLEPLTTLRVSLHDENGQKRDIVDYITKVVHTDRKMRRWREQDKQLVISVLSEKADGMFRWVYCQLEILRRNLPASIRDAIKELPETLYETYKHALLSIDKAKRGYAQRLFQCLAVSIRPLRAAELAEILAIRFEAGELPNYNVDWRLEDAEAAVLSVGSSLISVVNVDGSQVIQFSHFSVKEFLTSDHIATLGDVLSDYRILPGPAHTILAKACLSILLKLDDRVDKNTIENSPLVPYAARYWVGHAQFDDVSSRIQVVMERLFDPDRPHFAAWIWLYDLDCHWKEPMSAVHPIRPGAVPLYYAALCGFHGLVEHLIQACPSDVNAKGGYYMAPLHAALGSEYLKVMTLLLQRGAEVDVSDKRGSTPLHRASKLGALNIMQLLLEYGADVNAPNAQEETPLDVASGSGEIESARLLLQRGAVVDCRNEMGWTPLHRASGNGHLDVVQLLFHSGAVMDARTGSQDAPLDLASMNGHVEVSLFLIERGADMNSRNGHDWVPLDIAARYGHVDVAQLLLDRHVDVKIQDKYRWTPLHFASAYGHLEMAKLLVQRGASIDMRNDKEETPLDLASGRGHLDIARFLIESGANVSSRCSKGWTPFHTASKNGHRHVAEFLLQSGVNVDVRNGNEETALDLASGSGRLDVVRFLIEHGADVKARDNMGWNPLHVASQNGHVDVALLLLDCGADPIVQKDDLSTPLHLASAKGHIKIVRLLVEHGASVNSCNDLQETALHKAAGNGDLQVSRFLLDAGANLHAIDKEGWTPLHKASFSGHLVVVKLLLRRGADIDSQNLANNTAAHLASDNGKTNVASLLAEYKGDGDVRNKIRSTTLNTTVRDEDMTNYGEQTTLHTAVEAGELHIVEWFLERGADVDARDADYRTPLDLATTKGNLEITQLLIEHGAEIDSRDNIGWTPLHNASRYGHFDIARLLIDCGADVDARMQDNWTPLHLSAGSGHFEIVELLLARGPNIHHRTDEGQTAFQLAAGRGYRRITQLLMEHGAK